MPKIDLTEGPGGAGNSTFADKLNKDLFPGSAKVHSDPSF